MSATTKTLIAASAVLAASLAFAQSAPPTPAANPAVGQGQRSTQNTPMGATGTPGGGAATGSTSGTASTGSTSGSMATGSGSTGSTAGSTMSSGTSGSGSMAPSTSGMGTTRTARADRN
ncbi:MAG: proteophosphoglycan ppg4 [Ramlibacter sp.]